MLVELRAIRPTLASIKEVLAALLERERIRGDRRARESSGAYKRPEWSDGETTDLHSLVEMQRKPKQHKTPVMGVRQARPGSHHDPIE